MQVLWSLFLFLESSTMSTNEQDEDSKEKMLSSLRLEYVKTGKVGNNSWFIILWQMNMIENVFIAFFLFKNTKVKTFGNSEMVQ